MKITTFVPLVQGHLLNTIVDPVLRVRVRVRVRVFEQFSFDQLSAAEL
jgi:hypothetical protein